MPTLLMMLAGDSVIAPIVPQHRLQRLILQRGKDVVILRRAIFIICQGLEPLLQPAVPRMRPHKRQIHMKPHRTAHPPLPDVPPLVHGRARPHAVRETVRSEGHDVRPLRAWPGVGAARQAEAVLPLLSLHLAGVAVDVGAVEGQVALDWGKLYAAALRGLWLRVGGFRGVVVFGRGCVFGGGEGEFGFSGREAATAG